MAVMIGPSCPLGWKTWRYLPIGIETAGPTLQVEKLAPGLQLSSLRATGTFLNKTRFRSRPIWEIGCAYRARWDAHDTTLDTPLLEAHAGCGGHANPGLISYSGRGRPVARQAIGFLTTRVFLQG